MLNDFMDQSNRLEGHHQLTVITHQSVGSSEGAAYQTKLVAHTWIGSKSLVIKVDAILNKKRWKRHQRAELLSAWRQTNYPE